MSGIADQIRASRERIQQLKKVTPEIFHEYQRLQRAEHQMRIAADELNMAQAAWDRLGEDNN